MGGAFLAVADDYTATYWNPAGIAQIRRTELSGSMSHFNMTNKASYSDDYFTDETNATKFNSLGVIIPYPTYRGSLVFAVGYNRVRSFDGGYSFEHFFYSDTDSACKRSYNEIESGSLTNWVFSIAMDLSEHLSMGASVNIWRGNDDYLMSNFYDNEKNIDRFDHNYDRNINAEYSAVNFKFGALYKLGILGRIAATISTPIKFDVNEDWNKNWHVFDNYDPVYADYHEYIDTSSTTDYTIQSPITLGVGAAFTLFPNLVIAADVEYRDWSQMRYKSSPPLVNRTKSEANIDIKNNYRATAQFRVGAEFTVPLINLQLRAGYFNQPSPYEKATISAAKENFTAGKRYFTAGVGMLLDKQIKLDITWLKGWWDDERYISREQLLTIEEIFYLLLLFFA
jgi:long-subunit fatty acid transport protein